MQTMRILLLPVLALLSCTMLPAQQIILDKPVRAGELTLFPDMNNPNVYYYLPDKARLATDANGVPNFSFLRYVENVKSDDPSATLTEGQGGGIVHALVTLEVTPDQIKEAERDLRRFAPNGQIQGPIIYKSGRFALITSFTEANGDLAKKVCGTGSAPVLDGQKAAVSIFLTKLGAKILWESFKTSTPDISFSFEMTVEGFRMPKKAIIEANFDEIYKSFDLGIQAGIGTGGGGNSGGNSGGTTGGTSGTGGSRPASGNSGATGNSGGNSGGGGAYFGADIQYAFEELRKKGAIKVEQQGSDEAMENLITAAYTKLADMMFDRAQNNPGPQANPAQFLSGLTNTAAPSTSRSPLTGVMVSFKMKDRRQSGTFRLDLNKWTTDQIIMRFDENIGNLTRYQTNPKVFRQANLDDPLYRQREIFSMIDGYNATDFGTYINFVTVRMRKTHATGELTNEEVKIDRKNFNESANVFNMVYGWKGDDDRRQWMEYEYEVLWSLFGDVEVRQPFKKSTFNTINLAPPYQKREVEIQADPTLLTDSGVRLVTVKVYYKVENKEFVKQAVLNPAKNLLSQKLEYLSPSDNLNYEYEISWRLTGNRVVESGRKKGNDSVMFVDELPN